MAKRRFQIECLYAGIIASQDTHGPGPGTETLRDLHPLFLAALLAEQSPRLVSLYNSQSAQQREVINTMLAASTAFHYFVSGCAWKARLCLSSMPSRSQQLVLLAVQDPGTLATCLPPGLVARVSAAWMLRRPDPGFTDVDTAGAIVADQLRMAIVPDQAVVETLLSSAVRCSKAGAAVPIYASRHHPPGPPHAALVELAVLREALGKRIPRIHYDVLGTLVRAGNMDGALAVACALQSRQMFHLLISLWAARHPRDTSGIESIVRAMLEALDCKLLHSTHHIAVTSILRAGGALHPGAAKGRRALVLRALRLHRDLAPRLETPSAAAINQLMQAAADQDMVAAAFWVYHDAERRREWYAPRRHFANEAVLATLAGLVARHNDMRSIMHLTGVALRNNIATSSLFYTAVICGLTWPQGVKHSMNTDARSQAWGIAEGSAEDTASRNYQRHAQNYLKRLHIAEAVLASMRRCQIQPPPKAFHAIMYAWAVLGQPKKVQWCFSALQADSARDGATGGAGLSEAAWGILMYAYVRARKVRSVLGVLKRARRWLRRFGPTVRAPRADGPHMATSHLINMALLALIESGSGRAALSLLDRCITRAEEHAALYGSASRGELPATPGDRITLGLITRTLTENRRFEQAIRVHDDIHLRYALPEAPAELKVLLEHCLRQSDINGALCVVRRILQQGNTLSSHHWSHVLYQCAARTNSNEAVVYIYEQWCQSLGVDGIAQVPRALPQHAILATSIHDALRGCGRGSEATAMMASVRAARSPPVAPMTTAEARPSARAPEMARHRKLELYRALLREIRGFPIVELRGKLKHNARFIFDLYRDLDPRSPRVSALVNEGTSQLQWLRSWHAYPETCWRLAHRSEQRP